MAKIAQEIFFQNETLIREVAAISTGGQSGNAIKLISMISPTFSVYLTEQSVCILNGMMRLPLASLERANQAYFTNLRFHCDGGQNIKFKVPLNDTILLQTHLLLSCGAEFAIQYVTDCYLHHIKNDFIRGLYRSVMKRVTIFYSWFRLQNQGAVATRKALMACARVLILRPEAKTIMQQKLQLTQLHFDNGNGHCKFMCVWDSVQQRLGFRHTSTAAKNFKERPSAHAPKSLWTEDEVRLYHPDDFDRLVILSVMHSAWIGWDPGNRPDEFREFWKACGV